MHVFNSNRIAYNSASSLDHAEISPHRGDMKSSQTSLCKLVVLNINIKCILVIDVCSERSLLLSAVQ